MKKLFSFSSGKNALQKPQATSGTKRQDHDVTKRPVRDLWDIPITMYARSSGKIGYNFHRKPHTESNKQSSVLDVQKESGSGSKDDGAVFRY